MKQAVALDEVVMAVSVETLEHEEDCRCGLGRALFDEFMVRAIPELKP